MMVVITSLHRGGKQRKVVQEVREFRVPTGSVVSVIDQLQEHLDTARSQDCIDDPQFDYEVRDSYGDHEVHGWVVWYRSPTGEELDEDARIRREQVQAQRASAQQAIRNTIRRNPDLAREVLAEMEQS